MHLALNLMFAISLSYSNLWDGIQSWLINLSHAFQCYRSAFQGSAIPCTLCTDLSYSLVFLTSCAYQKKFLETRVSAGSSSSSAKKKLVFMLHSLFLLALLHWHNHCHRAFFMSEKIRPIWHIFQQSGPVSSRRWSDLGTSQILQTRKFRLFLQPHLKGGVDHCAVLEMVQHFLPVHITGLFCLYTPANRRTTVML